MLLNPLQQMRLANLLRKSAPGLPKEKRVRALNLAGLGQALARYQARSLGKLNMPGAPSPPNTPNPPNPQDASAPPSPAPNLQNQQSSPEPKEPSSMATQLEATTLDGDPNPLATPETWERHLGRLRQLPSSPVRDARIEHAEKMLLLLRDLSS